MVWAKNINLSQCKTAGWKIQLTAKKDVPVGATVATIQCVSVQICEKRAPSQSGSIWHPGNERRPDCENKL